ncbi:MAG: magnesium/cobalt transporter CorA [Bacteroidota bacterium]
MKNRLNRLYHSGRTLLNRKDQANNQGDKAGLPPGSLVYVGVDRSVHPSLELLAYNQEIHQEVKDLQLQDIYQELQTDHISWFNAVGVHQDQFIAELGEIFQLSPLIQEDIMDTRQRPKLEARDDYLFLPVKMIQYEEGRGRVQVEQVSLVLGSNYVLSFQEQAGDVLDAVRKRIRQKGSRVRNRGAAYLFYFIVDVIVSNYFIALEKFEDKIEALEDIVHNSQAPQILEQVLVLRKDLMHLRRVIHPLKEVIIQVQSLDHPLLHEDNRGFFQDLKDQVFLASDNLENFRDILTNIYDMHISLVSHRMNEIMKVLTVISTIFIPLSFLAGLYGMNFANMPELQQPLGYPILLGVMLIIVAGLLMYFRRKGWL